jgi:chemotaxis protein methyltransferase CheR
LPLAISPGLPWKWSESKTQEVWLVPIAKSGSKCQQQAEIPISLVTPALETRGFMYEQTMHLTDNQFKKYCILVYDECGIKLTDEKRALLNARISKRLRSLGVSAENYFEVVKKDPLEMGRFIDAVSTNHTYFFRESQSFKYISDQCADIWCAAASSGEEPYSLAAYCMQRGLAPSISATDISETCLQKGIRAIYPDPCIKSIPIDILKTCFQKGRNQWEGFVRVKPQVRKMVQFRKFNLLKDTLPDEKYDMIFCRNVMIYFDNPTKERVVERLCGVLKPKGYFIIGGAESLSGLKHELKYVEPCVYYKT